MSDKPPKVADTLPLKPEVLFAHRIGGKCVVTELGDGWICAHGTDGMSCEIECDEYEFEGEKFNSWTASSVGVDQSQSRIYFKLGSDEEDGEALVVSPDNTPFRASSKGRSNERSISFNSDGNPVPLVRLLYALKTGCERDRMTGLSELPVSCWGYQLSLSERGSKISNPTWGDIFSEMKLLSENEHLYHLFIGRMMAQSACDSDGLANWSTWEKVANRAFEENSERVGRYSGDRNPDFDAKFLLAVRDVAMDHGGLPSQAHVRKKWESLGAVGEWKDNRRKLGFDWLPPARDWKRDWLPLLQGEATD